MSKLSKRAMIYAKHNNYYRIGKIKKYLKLFDKKMQQLNDELGVSVCPRCGNTQTVAEYDDDEYSSDRFMTCDVCGECYDDEKYLDKLAEIESYNYFDKIEMSVWACDFKPPKTYAWFKECDKEMDEMIKELS